MLVSIILPCYNPPENWANNIIKELKALSEIISDKIELILVEDGIDEKLKSGIEFLKSNIPHFRSIRYSTNRGKGFALRQGVALAEGEIIIYTDIDFPYKAESVFRIYSALKNKECDVAVGIKNNTYYAHVPFARRVLSKGLQSLVRFFLSIPITDTQCGLKGFVKDVKPVFLQTSIDRYLFDLEFIRMAYKLKYKLEPLQIELKETAQFRVMNYRILFPEVLNFIKLVFKNKYPNDILNSGPGK
ncbi:glycosyltransferase [Aurantibacillus circumpalustris]|uniref:glycosyltransferase n=1 Tax=Aurantibacillus circumpalustris TaxID=3036359 RepID=UPI00295B1D30|nr:glycosyltransferase [Aurantibacillus circumpalustris]